MNKFLIYWIFENLLLFWKEIKINFNVFYYLYEFFYLLVFGLFIEVFYFLKECVGVFYWIWWTLF